MGNKGGGKPSDSRAGKRRDRCIRDVWRMRKRNRQKCARQAWYSGWWGRYRGK